MSLEPLLERVGVRSMIERYKDNTRTNLECCMENGGGGFLRERKDRSEKDFSNEKGKRERR
jgi:hypothetical protein